MTTLGQLSGQQALMTVVPQVPSVLQPRATLQSTLPRQKGNNDPEQFQRHVFSAAEQSSPPNLPVTQHYRAITFVDSDVGSTIGSPSNNSFSQLTSEEEGGRPAKRRRKQNPHPQQQKPTRLSRAKPVQNAHRIHSDAWRVIFANCDPKFLLDARLVCRDFKDILDDPGIWRSCRAKFFGPKLPPCPSGVSEQQYTNLLVGKGCQNPACERRETRKVYWSFMLRSCTNCLELYTSCDYQRETHDSTNVAYNACFGEVGSLDPPHYSRSLIDLLPCALSIGGKHRRSRGLDVDGRWTFKGGLCMYLNRDYERVKFEFEQLRQEPDADAAVPAWAAARWSETRKRMFSVQKIEDWENGFKQERGSVRMEKAQFYEGKALELSPPIEPEVLHKMAAFHNALDTGNRASERSWKLLLPKILPYREDATKLAKYGRKHGGYGSDIADYSVFSRIQNHREGREKPNPVIQEEQAVVIKLAKREFHNLVNRVADEDLLLLCLYNVRRAYENMSNKPRGLNYDGSTGEYILSLDDARMIVEEVFLPEISPVTVRGREIYEKLKCPGCTRADSSKTWTFTRLFLHIFIYHAQLVGEGHNFYKLLLSQKAPSLQGGFPWYMVPWPQNLPALPFHRQIVSTTRWHPDDTRPYVTKASKASTSAFQGRHARHRPGVAGDDFEGNFLYVAKAFKSTRLDSFCITKIALRYSLTRYADQRQSLPPLDRWQACVDMTPTVNPVVDFRFRCGICCKDAEMSKHHQCVGKPVQFSILSRHWLARHEGRGCHWSTHMMELPTASDLLDQMTSHDEKLKKEQDDCVRRDYELKQTNGRKKPDRKASVVLEKRMVMEVFDNLFPKDE